ncbi:MAG: (E)-4-hydroxy-3-methylbut-2-enyl-diphosphate synthase [Candidatus Amulumruptor caecigallinarius]|nr:(E)-4-hydroxy-3-methylbut-2-enyl-diphosphate synthase [Candidatus Amulumruptor caecigallinarius]MCM1396491.1 (E)-4-hydroxy-3-methylbut-2-enyl-diphosphate synthase [Candidatus Amulumruptor caecigallinarius]MCM1453452.1 (E)-4-hydroxy-3-methylbut-2-enyl-diphosphate synthase [bacterium]
MGNPKRRRTSEVRVGGVTIGGDNPVRLQSMTSTSTMDTSGSVAQAKSIADAGGEIVRLTAQGEREAVNLGVIRETLRAEGYDTPLVADIHFNPRAAFAAATRVEKVRINPGNFVDPGRTFKKLEYTDEEYAAELRKIEDALTPLLDVCTAHGTALRIGVNHGSLSDRIMSRYGDTPEGMVESAMEFLRVMKKHGFDQVVISIKASNVVVMNRTVRLLVEAMEREDMHYPLHLGVTEAGDGEDGRVKSAVGIGSLLLDGIGDTIRVSLSEDPAAEIPVARMIADYAASAPERLTAKVRSVAVPRVVGLDMTPDEAREDPERVLHAIYTGLTPDEVRVRAAMDLGGPLLRGEGDGVWIEADSLSAEESERLALGILQAARLRMSKTEYIACPGCGRTLFDLRSTLQAIKGATSHLKHLKIGVMGCIVNGPGEMADADYGYVGASAGHVTLYKGKTPVEKNVPQEQALDRLIALLKSEGVWQDPE